MPLTELSYFTRIESESFESSILKGMKVNKYIIFFILFFFINRFINAQDDRTFFNGFVKHIAGVEEAEDCSVTQDALISMTARCTNNHDYIEWETDQVPVNYSGKKISFIWSGGYSTGNEQDLRTFSLFVNEKLKFLFVTASRIDGTDWQTTNDNALLSFKNLKSYNRAGNKKDFWGYFILTIPTSELNADRSLKIKIKGDNTGSRHWFRVMEYKLLPKVGIKEEKIVEKDKIGKETQLIRISVDHYSNPLPIEIFSSEGKVFSDNLVLGRNDFYIKCDAVKSPSQKTFSIKVGNQSEKYTVMINPIKKTTFYLLAHSHVDIGYTDLQTEIEKKQWKNIDEGIRLAKLSSGNKMGSSFKWNVEVLWAVKSYLENFPEKKEGFFEAVRKGWIGLDATYANLLTGLSRPEELYRWLDYSNQLEREIGIRIESAMISDVPGYTWGVVQAFADNGVKYFSVGTNEGDRIGNALNKWGNKPFYWESPSGKDKILVWLAGKGYSWFHHWDLTSGDISPITEYIDELDANKYPYDIVQVRYTIGDNGGPNSLLPNFVEKWNNTHVTPQFKIATTAEMFNDFEKKYESIIPTFRGDFTPYWEDGAASSAKETALNRTTAELLTQLEILYTLTDAKNFPFKEFDEAWKNVLLYSEHTWGAYNSISEPEKSNVKDQWKIKSSFALKADSISQLLRNRLLNKKSEATVEYLDVWNSNSWTRSDLISVSAGIKTRGDNLVDESGQLVTTQKLNNGDLVFVAHNISPFSKKRFRFSQTNTNNIKAEGQPYDQSLKNRFPVEIEAIIDKQYPYVFNEFIQTGRNAVNPKVSSDSKIILKEKGPVVNRVIYSSSAPGCNSLLSEVRTFNDLDKTEIINTIDKKKVYEKENIRFAFPFEIENPQTRIDLAWSVMKPEVDQLPGANKNYFTAQRWIDVSNAKHGITIATIDAPFVELGGMNAESWMANSKNKWEEHAKSSAKIFSWVMNNSWHTNYKAEQEGITTFKYALQTHKQFDYSSAYRFGVEQAQPMLVSFSNHFEKMVPLIKLDEKTEIVITAIIPSRDGSGIIIRLYNPKNEMSSAKITCSNENARLFLSSGDENEIKLISSDISLSPFEVATIKVITVEK
ncbi:MAG: glycosyl hydrolase-related protein [Melioribacteraceae bacterium]